MEDQGDAPGAAQDDERKQDEEGERTLPSPAEDREDAAEGEHLVALIHTLNAKGNARETVTVDLRVARQAVDQALAGILVAPAPRPASSAGSAAQGAEGQHASAQDARPAGKHPPGTSTAWLQQQTQPQQQQLPAGRGRMQQDAPAGPSLAAARTVPAAHGRAQMLGNMPGPPHTLAGTGAGTGMQVLPSAADPGVQLRQPVQRSLSSSVPMAGGRAIALAPHSGGAQAGQPVPLVRHVSFGGSTQAILQQQQQQQQLFVLPDGTIVRLLPTPARHVPGQQQQQLLQVVGQVQAAPAGGLAAVAAARDAAHLESTPVLLPSSSVLQLQSAAHGGAQMQSPDQQQQQYASSVLLQSLQQQASAQQQHGLLLQAPVQPAAQQLQQLAQQHQQQQLVQQQLMQQQQQHLQDEQLLHQELLAPSLSQQQALLQQHESMQQQQQQQQQALLQQHGDLQQQQRQVLLQSLLQSIQTPAGSSSDPITWDAWQAMQAAGPTQHHALQQQSTMRSTTSAPTNVWHDARGPSAGLHRAWPGSGGYPQAGAGMPTGHELEDLLRAAERLQVAGAQPTTAQDALSVGLVSHLQMLAQEQHRRSSMDTHTPQQRQQQRRRSSGVNQPGPLHAGPGSIRSDPVVSALSAHPSLIRRATPQLRHSNTMPTAASQAAAMAAAATGPAQAVHGPGEAAASELLRHWAEGMQQLQAAPPPPPPPLPPPRQQQQQQHATLASALELSLAPGESMASQLKPRPAAAAGLTLSLDLPSPAATPRTREHTPSSTGSSGSSGYASSRGLASRGEAWQQFQHLYPGWNATSAGSGTMPSSAGWLSSRGSMKATPHTSPRDLLAGAHSLSTSSSLWPPYLDTPPGLGPVSSHSTSGAAPRTSLDAQVVYAAQQLGSASHPGAVSGGGASPAGLTLEQLMEVWGRRHSMQLPEPHMATSPPQAGLPPGLPARPASRPPLQLPEPHMATSPPQAGLPPGLPVRPASRPPLQLPDPNLASSPPQAGVPPARPASRLASRLPTQGMFGGGAAPSTLLYGKGPPAAALLRPPSAGGAPAAALPGPAQEEGWQVHVNSPFGTTSRPANMASLPATPGLEAWAAAEGGAAPHDRPASTRPAAAAGLFVDIPVAPSQPATAAMGAHGHAATSLAAGYMLPTPGGTSPGLTSPSAAPSPSLASLPSLHSHHSQQQQAQTQQGQQPGPTSSHQVAWTWHDSPSQPQLAQAATQQQQQVGEDWVRPTLEQLPAAGQVHPQEPLASAEPSAGEVTAAAAAAAAAATGAAGAAAATSTGISPRDQPLAWGAATWSSGADAQGWLAGGSAAAAQRTALWAGGSNTHSPLFEELHPAGRELSLGPVGGPSGAHAGEAAARGASSGAHTGEAAAAAAAAAADAPPVGSSARGSLTSRSTSSGAGSAGGQAP